MDSERNPISDSDNEGIPAEVVREIIRRSLESAPKPLDFFRFSEIGSADWSPVFVPPNPSETPEIGPPKSLRSPDGLLTGFRDFDRIVGGLRRGEITTIAGLPSCGSSTLVQNIVRRIITANDSVVAAFYTLDAPGSQVVQRLLGAQARIDWHSAQAGLLRDVEWTRLTESVQSLWNGKLFITDERLVSPEDLYEACALRKSGVGLDLIVLDRVNVFGIDPSGETPPLGETMADLKSLATDLDVPVLLTYTADPKLADDDTYRFHERRLPPAIQVYSDVLTLLHRPDYWITENHGNLSDDIPERQKGLEVVEWSVARQTGGSSDSLRLAFNARWGRFDNVLWEC